MTGLWINLIRRNELCDGDVKELSFDGQDLLVFRTAAGELGALSAYCPHLQNYIPNGLAPGVSLQELLRGEELVCPFHGWRFDNAGHCTGIPPGQSIPKKVARGEPISKSWALREQDGWIQIAG